MKWEQMQKPLREGMQVFRMDWPDDMYAMIQEEETGLAEFFSGEHPEGVPFAPSAADLEADDWAATGPSGT